MKRDYEKLQSNKKTTSGFNYYDLEVKNIPLLTKDEEQKLFIAIGKQRKLISKLTDEEEIKKEEMVLYKLTDKIVRANLGLVISIASKYNNSSNDLNDLIQEGNMGLLTAINKFDPEQGYKFSTYATYWIRQKIHRFLIIDRPLVLPYNKQEKKVQINNIIVNYTELYGKEPTDEEIIKIYNEKYPKKINLLELETIKNLPITTNSLDQEYNNLEDGKILPEQLRDEDLIDEKVTKQIDMEMVDKIVDEKLTKKQKYVIDRRYGLNNNEMTSYQSIADDIKISKTSARQLERSSLKKLKRSHTLKLLYLDYFKGGKHE